MHLAHTLPLIYYESSKAAKFHKNLLFHMTPKEFPKTLKPQKMLLNRYE